MFPSTVERVPRHTAEHVNRAIQDATDRRVQEFRNSETNEINQRLHELAQEWDIERTLETNAAVVSLIGVALGATVDRRWFALPAVVAGFLLQHALFGWCPPLPIFRRLGVRTSYEIDRERYALKSIRLGTDRKMQAYSDLRG